MPSLEIISVNIWQILISLCNLLLLFLIVKKFLFKPVKKMLAKRQEAIDDQYAKADEARTAAEQANAKLTEQLQNAAEQAEQIVQKATQTANRRSEQIVNEAKDKAEHLLQQANATMELERKKASAEMKEEIVTISTALAEKMLEREIHAEDHRGLINAFMQEIGDDHDLNS